MVDILTSRQIEQSIRILPKIEDGISPQELKFLERVKVSKHVILALGHAVQIPEGRENSPFRLYPVNGLSDLGSLALWAAEEQTDVDFIVLAPDATGQTRVDLITVLGGGRTLADYSQDNLLKEWQIAHPGRSTIVTFLPVPDFRVTVGEEKGRVIEKGGYRPRLMFGVDGKLKTNQQAWALINTDYLPYGKLSLEFQKTKAELAVADNLERLRSTDTVISVETRDTNASQTPTSRDQPSDQATDLADQIKVGKTSHRHGA